MRKLILLLLFLNIIMAHSQSKDYISNNQNFQLSPFIDLVLKKDKTNYGFEVKTTSFSFDKYHDKRDAKRIGIDEYSLNSAISYVTYTNPNNVYYYPLNPTFFKNKKVFQKIYSNSSKNLLLKIFVTIYKTSWLNFLIAM